MHSRSALPLLAVLGCPAESTTADEGQSTADEVGETTTNELETTGAADRCGEPQCDLGNPCQTITCCGPNDPDCQPIFHDVQVVSGWMLANNGCTIGCHGAAAPAAGLSLVAEDDPWCSLVNRPSSGPSRLSLVEPGQPTQSYLWHKLQARTLAHASGVMVPRCRHPPAVPWRSRTRYSRSWSPHGSAAVLRSRPRIRSARAASEVS